MAENKNTLPALLNSEPVKKRFVELLDKDSTNFIQTLLSIYNSSDQLKKCDPTSILTAAGLAATLKLPINPSLGYAYIVPYGNKAQFQLGVRGLMQLAHRTGRYVAVHSGVVREGEIRGVDCVTGELIRGEKISEEIVGYVAYMKLINGFEKAIYMTKKEVEEHAQSFSQGYKYQKGNSLWGKYFDKMACKTVLKMLILKWGPTSGGLAEALSGEQTTVAKVADAESATTIESIEMPADSSEIVDDETGEILKLE